MGAGTLLGAGRRRAGPDTVARYLPLGAFAVVLALVVALLPTALRPPQQPPNESAEFSPDAPPDDKQESLVAALRRGTSSAAGARGDGSPAGGIDAPAGPDAPPPPEEVARLRSCPLAFGDPPRQTESVYSAPCALAWDGDNGGATWKGVTATEVRVGQMQPSGSDGGQGTPGPVSETMTDDQEQADRVWTVYQTYFNRYYQFWGRYLRFVLHPTGGSEAERRGAVADADERYGLFGAYSNGTPTLEELARRGMVGMGGYQLDGDLYRNNRPYLFSWFMDGDTLVRHNVEYICKKLEGKPAVHAGDPTFHDRPRKFGFVISTPANSGSTGIERRLPGLLESQCGITDAEFVVITGATDQATATAITRFRLAGVTTVVPFTDPISVGPLTQAADAQAYHPEWIITGMWEIDRSEEPIVFQYSKNQWSHAFGLSPQEFFRPPEEKDWWRAYKTIDPHNDPPYWAEYIFHPMQQFANGIQMAGPALTPATFEQGLFRMGKQYWPGTPFIGGGYGPGDFSYADDVAEIWWDPTAPHPTFDGTRWSSESTEPLGNYRAVRCDLRYRLGEHPREDTKAFEQGCFAKL